MSDEGWHWESSSSTRAPSTMRRREARAMEATSGALTVTEVEEILDVEGAREVLRVPIAAEANLVDWMVMCSAMSKPHLRGMADALVRVLKRRGLGDARAADGRDAGDDWIAVDCGSTFVHLMMPEARERLQLEDHWDPSKPRPHFVHEDDVRKRRRRRRNRT